MKKRRVPERTVYYKDALNDDFAGTHIHRKTVDAGFCYEHKNPLWRLLSFLLYYGIAVPLVWVYVRCILRVKFVNRKGAKRCGGTPCYLYGNHTGYVDAFIPNLLSVRRRNRIIVSADTVSIRGLKHLTQMLGAVPVPTGIRGMKKFTEAIDRHHKTCNITVYPEAHIWPYYTGVRPFSDTSFGYAIKHRAPVIAFFTAYTAPKGFLSCFRKANRTVYVSDPLYPDDGLPYIEARRNLRDKVYAFMQEASRHSTYEVIRYLPENATAIS